MDGYRDRQAGEAGTGRERRERVGAVSPWNPSFEFRWTKPGLLPGFWSFEFLYIRSFVGQDIYIYMLWQWLRLHYPTLFASFIDEGPARI
jgi:hypothetical protein